MDESAKTVVLGFDALDFRYLDRFNDALPNFASIRDDGVEAPLQSTFPPWTGSAWPSMYTGTDPSHHGVYGFFDFGTKYPDEAELVTRNHVKAPGLWNYLSARDLPAVVMNVPVTHPADPIEGVLIPGYLAGEDSPGHPSDIREELADELGEEYRIYSRAEMSDDKSEKLAGYKELIKLRTKAAKYLLENYDWEVAVVQVQKTDAVFHNFTDDETFREIYELADELVGTARAAAPDANVVICSDHGIGPVDGYNIYVNEVLREHGYIQTTDEDAGTALGEEKLSLTGQRTDPDGDGEAGLRTAAISRAATLLRRVGVSPADVYTYAQRAGIGSLLTRVVPPEAIDSVGENIDWRRSMAYCRGSTELGVQINLAGRQPDGVVSEEEYEEVRSDIIRILSTLRTPDGDPAFEFVKRREEVYDGPYAENACDVVFLPAEMNHVVMTTLVGKRFVPIDSFDHKQFGTFIAAGPAFDTAADLTRLSLTDVAPIVLASVGLDVPEWMTGSVPEGLLSGDVSRGAYPDVTYGTEPDETDDDLVEDRLDALGYL